MKITSKIKHLSTDYQAIFLLQTMKVTNAAFATIAMAPWQEKILDKANGTTKFIIRSLWVLG